MPKVDVGVEMFTSVGVLAFRPELYYKQRIAMKTNSSVIELILVIEGLVSSVKLFI